MKKEEIIEISLDLFLEKGYERTTITNIMKKTNLSKGGMYHYFSSKEEILIEATKKALKEVEVNFNKIVEKEKSLEKKFVFLFYPAIKDSKFLNSFSKLKNMEKNSIVIYKIREIEREFGIKYLKKFVNEGISLNYFEDIEFKEDVIDILYGYGEKISFDSLKIDNKNKFYKEKFKVLLFLIERLLNPKKEFIDNLENYLMEYTNGEEIN